MFVEVMSSDSTSRRLEGYSIGSMLEHTSVFVFVQTVSEAPLSSLSLKLGLRLGRRMEHV